MRRARALVSSCWALRTSRVVRCPPAASFLTPSSAIVVARTSDSPATTDARAPSSALPGSSNGGLCLGTNLIQDQATLRDELLGLSDLRRSKATIIDRHVDLSEERGLIEA